MSGADDVTVVWVAPAEAREDSNRALAEWGRARGLTLVAAAEGTASLLKVDLAVADRVEKELDRAREAIAALDADIAERALARAEAILREHPELPQGAWLRAEVHRSWAARFTRIDPRDDARAQLAWQEADALDGGRAAGIGEVAFPPRARSAATLALSGAPSRKLVARLDGAELAGTAAADGTTTYALDVPAAEHQLVVSIDGDAVFASWIAIAPAAAGAPRVTIPIHIGDDGACSASSLANVTRDGAGVRATNVSCPHWVVAAASERHGGVLVARCERSQCGPFLEWRTEAGFSGGPATQGGTHGGRWPAWATWTAVGVGVLAATTVALIASGVFETRPVEQRFVSGGVRVE